MPQIANQDYNVVGPKLTILRFDYQALAELRGHYDRGTIFDVLIKGVIVDESVKDSLSRVVSVIQMNDESFPDLVSLIFHNYDGSEIGIGLDYKFATLNVLGIIQQGFQIGGNMPLSKDESGYFMAQKNGDNYGYITVGGNLVKVTIDSDEKLVSYELTDTPPVDGALSVDITEKDMRELIGVYFY